MMGETGTGSSGDTRAYFQQGREAIRELDDRLEDTVRDHPLTAIFAAVGFGIILGIALTVACPASFPQLKNRR